MSTAPQVHEEEQNQADDFSALEERVVRLVDVVRNERQQRQRAEENAATLQQLLDEQGAHLQHVEDELRGMERDRDQVRGRVERLLRQLDEVDA